MALEELVQLHKVVSFGDHATSNQKQIAIVSSYALGNEARRKIVFSAVVVGHHFGRADADNVPGMEKLMRTNAQQVFVSVGTFQQLLCRTKCDDGGVEMFYSVVGMIGKKLIDKMICLTGENRPSWLSAVL